MKLTGKCKEDFEEWMLVNNKELVKFSEERYSEVIDMSQLFKYLTDSMQYGVIVDFFDSVGFYIDVNHNYRLEVEDNIIILGYYYELNILPNTHILEDADDYNTRQEARIKAIEKANEIYNYEKTKD
jgi:hypothetical protein